MNLYGEGSGAADVQPLPVQLPFAPGQPGLCDSKSLLPAAKRPILSMPISINQPLTVA
jgi:hypothetical protein